MCVSCISGLNEACGDPFNASVIRPFNPKDTKGTGIYEVNCYGVCVKWRYVSHVYGELALMTTPCGKSDSPTKRMNHRRQSSKKKRSVNFFIFNPQMTGINSIFSTKHKPFLMKYLVMADGNYHRYFNKHKSSHVFLLKTLCTFLECKKSMCI